MKSSLLAISSWTDIFSRPSDSHHFLGGINKCSGVLPFALLFILSVQILSLFINPLLITVVFCVNVPYFAFKKHSSQNPGE